MSVITSEVFAVDQEMGGVHGPDRWWLKLWGLADIHVLAVPWETVLR